MIENESPFKGLFKKLMQNQTIDLSPEGKTDTIEGNP